jgi:hypothetical protein
MLGFGMVNRVFANLNRTLVITVEFNWLVVIKTEL